MIAQIVSSPSIHAHVIDAGFIKTLLRHLREGTVEFAIIMSLQSVSVSDVGVVASFYAIKHLIFINERRFVNRTGNFSS